MKVPEIKKIKLSDYKQGDYNPRHIDPQNRQGLENSIKRFGLVQPIIVNKRTGNVVGGNQRFGILKERDQKETNAVIVDLNIDDEKTLNLALNNYGIQGEFSDDVSNILKQIREKNIDDFDSLRLFDIDFEEKEDIMKKLDDEEIPPEMAIQPFEHYDYAVILADNIHDWQWLKEFLELKNQNVSPAGNVRIGLGRGLKVKDFKQILDKKYKDKNKDKNNGKPKDKDGLQNSSSE